MHYSVGLGSLIYAAFVAWGADRFWRAESAWGLEEQSVALLCSVARPNKSGACPSYARRLGDIRLWAGVP